ncbi:MAG TPA: hypothetical protein VFR86_19230 [Burkholderiaceae bacterium]|nr:hypothetical protein [Burkholderiaceae bacterium]
MAAQSHDAQSFALSWREFLDEFYWAPSPQALAAEPRNLRQRFADDGYADAFLAAIAAHLARAHGWTIPAWALAEKRIASRPFFALRSRKGWALLLQESPAEFRARNLFVTANVLSRA